MTNNISILNPPVIFKYFFPLNWKISAKALFIIFVMMILAFSVIYIIQITREVSETYLVSRYQSKIDELSNKNQSLEIELQKNSALENVVVSLSALNFEKIEKVQYIKVIGNQVVKK